MDMKGGIVIALAALEALDDVGIPSSWSFLLNADEESGSYASDRTLRDQAAKHDIGLAFEPALPDGGLVIARPGSAQFMLEVRGKAAHVGRDFTSGISAVNALAQRLLHIARLPKPDQGLIVSVGPIDGGTASNIVPDRARAWGNIRFPDQAAADRVLHELESLATPPTQSALPTVQLRTSLSRPPKPTTPRVHSLALLARQAAEDLGQNLPFATTAGVCDGNNLQAAGLPTIDTLGVIGGGAHTPNEWIDLNSLVPRCQLVALLLARLASGALPTS
jgi:glutamate carboxypeptidase